MSQKRVLFRTSPWGAPPLVPFLRLRVSWAIPPDSAVQVQPQANVITGEPREAICDAVDQLRANLLVMGSHGYGTIARYGLRQGTGETPAAMRR